MSKELLLVAEALSNERGVSKEVIILAIQAALESATRKIFGCDMGILSMMTSSSFLIGSLLLNKQKNVIQKSL